MAITLRQSNALFTGGNVSASFAAWSPATVAGNLLLLFVHNFSAAAGTTWSATPAGYTAYSPTPFGYGSVNGQSGIFWKIAAGSDATPGVVTRSSGTANWETYAAEFNNPAGWVATPSDAEAHSAATGTAGVSKASGSTAALAQANELAVALLTPFSGTSLIPTFNGGFVLDTTISVADTMDVAWQETASTAALATTADWTGGTSTIAGCRIATFKTVASAVVKRQLAMSGVGR